jgi:hypothetical protein
MQLHTSLAILPVAAALGACSGSGGSNGQSPAEAGPGSGEDVASDDAGAGEDARGDDVSAVEASDGGAPGSDGGETEYYAEMFAGQVVPLSTAATRGLAQLYLEADGKTVRYDITHSVANPRSVGVHIGAPGESGTATHQLPNVADHMTGSFTLTTAEQNALAVDQLYVDVTSPEFPDGEIRGQVTVPGATIFVAVATGTQQVPRVSSAYTAHASLILSPDGATFRYHAVSDVVPTSVVIGRGIAGVEGVPVHQLVPVETTIDGTLHAAASDPADLQAGRLYVSVQTEANPAGELRGQIVPVGAILFTGVLAGSNEVPPVSSAATGGVQFVLSPDRETLTYDVVVTGVIPTSADLELGSAGQTGQTLHLLELKQQAASGDITPTLTDMSALFDDVAFVNVGTASFSGGELRAQLTRR